MLPATLPASTKSPQLKGQYHHQAPQRKRAQINFNEGGMATCAGGQVVLIPATQYAKERMQRVFNGKEVLFYPRIGEKDDIRFEPDDPAYARLMKVVTCDNEGNFEFTALTDGEFIVGTTINWGGGNSAAFMRQVRLHRAFLQSPTQTQLCWQHQPSRVRGADNMGLTQPST